MIKNTLCQLQQYIKTFCFCKFNCGFISQIVIGQFTLCHYFLLCFFNVILLISWEAYFHHKIRIFASYLIRSNQVLKANFIIVFALLSLVFDVATKSIKKYVQPATAWISWRLDILLVCVLLRRKLRKLHQRFVWAIKTIN